jgi:hypothetical protein
MLLVCVGILEFGRAYQTWQVVTNAPREARASRCCPNMRTTRSARAVKTYLKNGGCRRGRRRRQHESPDHRNHHSDRCRRAATAPAARIVVEYPFTFMVLQPVAKLVVNGSLAVEPFTMRMTTIMRNE